MKYEETPFEREYIIRRHGKKAKGTEKFKGKSVPKNELAPIGWRQGQLLGQMKNWNLERLGQRAIVLRIHSELPRTKQMSDAIAAQITRGTVQKNSRVNPKFNLVGLNREKVAEVEREVGEAGWVSLVHQGKDVGQHETHQQLGDRHLDEITRIDEKIHAYLKRKPVDPLDGTRRIIDITGHAPGIGALVIKLFGEQSQAAKSVREKPERMSEEVKIGIMNGRAIAKFRKHEKDVTHLFPHLLT